MKQSYNFEPYHSDACTVPITKITPDDGYYVFTYFDVCPFSPSQRYLATTRLPFQNRLPILGDTADVCVIDLEEQTIEAVYTTKSWAYQTGALLNWGTTDHHLYTNDIIDDRAVCVRIDLESGETTPFSGPMYNIAPDESSVVGFPLELMDISQAGYGAPCKDPHNPKKLPPGAATDEGIWKTDLRTNTCTLLVSLADVAAQLPEPPPQENGTFYFWHAKFNRRSNRIMVVLRCLFPDNWGRRNPSTFTIKPDGSDLCYLPFTHPWNAGGGHANWHADSKHLIRHITEPDGSQRYCQVRADGTKRTILSEHLTGGGHPSIEPTGRYIVTDARSDDRVTLRLSDLETHQEHDLCTLPTFDKASMQDTVFRLDGHPVWNRDYNKVCIQAAPEGARQLFIADLSDYLN